MAEATGLLGAINQWPLQRKLSLAAVILISVGLFTFIIIQGKTADYRLLYANLTDTDASAMIDWLKDQKIPYQIQSGGKAIYIPADKVYETRLNMAGSGIPSGGGVGFEIFDKQNFGMSDFAQKVNYQRALQGELSRTISTLEPVEGAKVLLALPEKRLFKDQQQEATASVIVKISPGKSLKDSQVQGIVHLVAASIEGLDAENVTVVNSTGQVLSNKAEKQPGDSLTPGMQSYQQATEHRLEQRAQALLDRALGVNNSLVKVTAVIDFSQMEKTEETYDPAGSVPRSEQVSEEKSGSESTGGIPGVQANLGGNVAAAGGSTSTRTTETINYEISKVISRVVAPVGDVKSLSIAVLVGDKIVPPEAEGGEPTYTQRTPEELQSIQNMIGSALGLNETRGDKINVVSMPFESDFIGETAVESPQNGAFYQYLPYVKYGLLVVGTGLAYLLLVRPMLRTLSVSAAAAPTAAGQIEGESVGGLLAAPADPTSRIRQDIMRSQTSPSQVIKTWLSQT